MYIMKKVLFVLYVVFLSFGVGNAQNVNVIMKNVLNKFNASKNISADFIISSSQMSAKGSIVMCGTKFRIITKDYMCWYDGKTQWIYTTYTNEVNLLEPSKEELEANNPYFAVMRYNTNFKPFLNSQTNTDYLVQLNSKNRYVDMSSLILTIDKKTNLVKKAVATMIDNTSQTIELTNYKVNEKLDASVFVFDKKMVPQGTQVIDLR